MIINCTSCSTRFLVDAAAIGRKGRQVRCARCQHDWFQSPADDLPRPAEPHQGAAGKAPDQPPPRPTPLRKGANLPVIPRAKNQLTNRLAWGALIAVIAAVPLTLISLQSQITVAWPAAARLYTALGMADEIQAMKLADVSFAQSFQDGIPVLTVKGAILNEGAADAMPPAVMMTLRDSKGASLRSWVHRLPQTIIAANGRVEFETSHRNPPPDASNLDVTFAPAGADTGKAQNP